MRLPTHHNRSETDVAMTPMIDVVFQLLIFFICTASFQATEELLPMGLADTRGTEVTKPTELAPDPKRIVVQATHADGQTKWVVNDRTTGSLRDVQELLTTAVNADRSIPVTLDVAGAVPLGDMIDVYDLCRLLGLEKIEFAVETK